MSSNEDKGKATGDAAFLDVEKLFQESMEHQEGFPQDQEVGVMPQPSKLEVVSKVADSVAHELNNVLATIIGLASVIETEVDVDSAIYQDIRGILTASRRGIRLTRNLLGFSKDGDPLYKEQVKLPELLGKVVGLLQRTMPPEVEISADIASDLDPVEVDANQIRNMIINLAANSVDAISGKGAISIKVRSFQPGQDAGPGGANLRPGRYLSIQVADTGRGMDSETMRRAFEPFFTTKPAGTASGLGLPLVYRIIKGHNGHVDLYSKEGLGTTVTVYLPALGPEPRKQAQKPRPEPRRATGAILLVDDEELVRLAARRILKKIGYNVLMAGSGAEALEMLKSRRSDIGAAIVDLIMPEMDGIAVLKEMIKIAPELPVIISSGYAKEEPSKEIMRLGARAFVEKPYTLKEISEKLAVVLGKPA
jgi:nitrogen-specific signal transduction histidine kinase/CheY-like chemotaxis protein